ncbi:hypothetical protein [Paenibacillus ihuae]|uniref:hypothetical protein n=1 Tax=Paenibacillus ihuae TaxID=1232431 RepID=UPI0006D544E1|nr:hypothetical protein [Paenibacillus ihuae]
MPTLKMRADKIIEEVRLICHSNVRVTLSIISDSQKLSNLHINESEPNYTQNRIQFSDAILNFKKETWDYNRYITVDDYLKVLKAELIRLKKVNTSPLTIEYIIYPRKKEWKIYEDLYLSYIQYLNKNEKIISVSEKATFLMKGVRSKYAIRQRLSYLNNHFKDPFLSLFENISHYSSHQPITQLINCFNEVSGTTFHEIRDSTWRNFEKDSWTRITSPSRTRSRK